MENYVDQMIAEKEQLKNRIDKLEIFIGSYAYKKLSQENQKLLNKQLSYMMGYLNVLTERIILNGGAR